MEAQLSFNLPFRGERYGAVVDLMCVDGLLDIKEIVGGRVTGGDARCIDIATGHDHDIDAGTKGADLLGCRNAVAPGPAARADKSERKGRPSTRLAVTLATASSA